MHTDNKERVTTVAMRLFLQRGIRSVRMDDIAHECGISKRTLYEMYKDREALIEESLSKYIAEAKLSNIENSKAAENILHAFWLVFTNNNPYGITHTIVEELKRYYPKLMERLLIMSHEDIVHDTQEKLSEGVRDGLIMPHLDLEFFSRALTNYIYGLGIIEANTDITGVVLTERTVPSAIIIFLRGISTEKGRRYIDENLLENIIEE